VSNEGNETNEIEEIKEIERYQGSAVATARTRPHRPWSSTPSSGNSNLTASTVVVDTEKWQQQSDRIDRGRRHREVATATPATAPQQHRQATRTPSRTTRAITEQQQDRLGRGHHHRTTSATLPSTPLLPALRDSPCRGMNSSTPCYWTRPNMLPFQSRQ
jgi:hypothetical protein